MNTVARRTNKVHLGLVGRFKIEAIKRDGSRRLLADWFDNLILNSGLDRIGTANTIAGAMVGTGSTTPSAVQTALDAQIAYTTVPLLITHGANTSENYLSRTMTYRFAEGAAAGNLTEVGVGWASGSCFSRALILDGGGSPTTLTVLSDETLDVTYELRIYPMTSEVVSIMTLDSIDYDVVLKTARLNGTDASAFFGFINSLGMGSTSSSMVSGSDGFTVGGALGDIYTTAGGSGGIGPGTYTPQAYSGGSYQRTLRYVWGLANGSSAFYNFIFRTPMGYFKASFDPQVPKTSSNILTLDLQVTWARKTL